MEHECKIGLLYHYDDTKLVTIKSLKEEIEARTQWKNTIFENLFKYYDFSDYGDKRKSTDLFRFEYCPECGKKIDWKAIRNMKVEE